MDSRVHVYQEVFNNDLIKMNASLQIERLKSGVKRELVFRHMSIVVIGKVQMGVGIVSLPNLLV